MVDIISSVQSELHVNLASACSSILRGEEITHVLQSDASDRECNWILDIIGYSHL